MPSLEHVSAPTGGRKLYQQDERQLEIRHRLLFKEEIYFNPETATKINRTKSSALALHVCLLLQANAFHSTKCFIHLHTQLAVSDYTAALKPQTWEKFMTAC